MRILKYLASSQFATIVDFVITVLLSSFLGVYYVLASAIGAVSGGMANCMVNYRWVFPGAESEKWHVGVKYFAVWLASISLNTFGTYMLTESIRESAFVEELLGESSDQIYIAAKVVVAITVALAWNYPLQRFYVYK